MREDHKITVYPPMYAKGYEPAQYGAEGWSLIMPPKESGEVETQPTVGEDREGGREKYPLSKLKVGQAFFIPDAACGKENTNAAGKKVISLCHRAQELGMMIKQKYRAGGVVVTRIQ